MNINNINLEPEGTDECTRWTYQDDAIRNGTYSFNEHPRENIIYTDSDAYVYSTVNFDNNTNHVSEGKDECTRWTYQDEAIRNGTYSFNNTSSVKRSKPSCGGIHQFDVIDDSDSDEEGGIITFCSIASCSFNNKKQKI